MSGKGENDCCGPGGEVPCGPGRGSGMCCAVESIVSVDERGQMVLPKDLREKAGITPGEKLILASCMKDGKLHMMVLIRSGDFQGMVNDFLGPLGEGGGVKGD